MVVLAQNNSLAGSFSSLKEIGDSYKRSIKRLYFVDMSILKHLCLNDCCYASELPRIYHRSLRTIQRHLTKLEHLGYIYRYGSSRCPFQSYRLHNEYDREAMVRLIADRLVELWRENPKRYYFNITFIIATCRSSYGSSSKTALRPDNHSISYCNVAVRVSVPFTDMYVPSLFFDSVLDCNDGFDAFKWVIFRFEGLLFDLDSFDDLFLFR